jgi:GTP-binding protein HflX
MEPHSSKGQTEKAILVGLSHREQSSEKLEEYLDELDFLSRTLGLKPVHRFTQNLDMPHIATFVGSGKLEEIKTYVKDNKIDVVIFDDDLSPSQMRNIEKTLDRKIYDRSLLILDIFQSRAQTAQAKTQVELARNEYLLPRLTRMWNVREVVHRQEAAPVKRKLRPTGE